MARSTKAKELTWVDPLDLSGGTLLLALTGWMDGGLVSTGTVKQMMEGRDLSEVARIGAGGYYIENFPGGMEVSAIFRPEVKYKKGLIKRFEMPANLFYADAAAKILFFLGKEPNADWDGFGRCIFEVAKKCGIRRMIFMGSFGGTVPHTRAPRMFGSVSDKSLLPVLKRYGVRPSDYEGPASFATYLTYHAPAEGVEMISLSAEIPGYLEGANPTSIEAVARRLGGMLGVEVDLGALRTASTAWEIQVTEAVEKDEDLAKRVKELEEAYDTELLAESED
jgi:proteasome assembly chaperone (PAC2) family protein